MAQLGLSLYPEHSTPERDHAYLELAGRYGFKRVFSCLLSVQETPEKVIKEMRDLTDTAHKNGLEVVLDVAPSVFDALGASFHNLAVFREMGADGIRLDTGFDGHKEAFMSYNPEGLKIELNASMDPDYVLNVLAHKPKRESLLACHNFYPQKYTGLGLKHFDYCNEILADQDLRLAAFVSSNAEGTYGPWAVNEGLCTLEMHRGLPIDFQVRHLFADGKIDDVLIANAYATEDEIAACAAVDPAVLTFGLILEKELTPMEKAIVDFKEGHVIRGDLSDYMIRSTWTRVAFKDADIPAANTRDLKRGDVVIVNNGYGRYKGELHVVTQPMPNDGRKNVIGHLPRYEHILLDYIEPWRRFAFTEVEKQRED